eukprot:445830_1
MRSLFRNTVQSPAYNAELNHIKRYISSSITNNTTNNNDIDTNDEFDLCVIGCGSGGFTGAIRGWDYGKKIAVINPLNNLGGATIHNGALSSKVMWQLSRQARHLKSIYNHPPPTDNNISEFETMKNRVYESTNIKVNHYLRQLNDLKKESNKSTIRYSSDEDGGGGNITLFDGKAKFIDKHIIEINDTNNNKTKIKSKNFLIATGSRPRKIINKNNLYIESDGEYILTSDDILNMNDFPESILIYGAGVIGCEFATIFSNYNITKNIILFNENRDRLLPFEDKEISQFLSDNLQFQSKVTVANNVNMKHMEIDYVKQKVKCCFNDINNEENIIYVDKVLLAAGRVPNIDNLNVDIDINNVDNHLRLINNSHIYLCGDALGKWGLVSIAEMESRHSIEYMFGSKNPITRLEYDDISSVMFVRPEISCIGMNEIECQKRGISYKCALLRLGLINRSVIDWNVRNMGPIQPKQAGFIKMIVTDDDDKQLLGLRCCGVGSSASLQTAAILIKKKESIREIEKLCHAHPAINESVQECARMLLGRSIYKPHIWPRSYLKHWSPEKGQVLAEEVIKKRFRQTVPGYI